VEAPTAIYCPNNDFFAVEVDEESTPSGEVRRVEPQPGTLFFEPAGPAFVPPEA
jgi:hypothetical protein